MSLIGSYALLLALVLSAYSFIAGIWGLVGKDTSASRISETARRAGIATFAVVFLAAVVLVVAALQTTFPSPIFFTIPIAICLSPTRLRLSGPDKKARCCSGRCCWPLTD